MTKPRKLSNVDFIGDSDLTKRLLKDRSQKIRQHAVNSIPPDRTNEFKAEIYQLVFDASAGIRAVARLALSRVDQFDFRQIYNEQLFKRKLHRLTLLGLE